MGHEEQPLPECQNESAHAIVDETVEKIELDAAGGTCLAELPCECRTRLRGVPRPNEWARPSENDGVPWKHSDMKDVAYYYVYKLFEQLIQEGNLK